MAEATAQIDVMNTAAQTELRGFVETIERATEDKKSAEEAIAETYRAARGRGYDVAVIKELIKERTKDPALVAEKNTVLDLYRHAVRAG